MHAIVGSDAFERAEPDGGSRHDSAGVAGGNDCIGPAFLDQLDRPQERAVLLLAEPLDRLVVHGQHLAGLLELQPFVPEADFFGQGPELGFGTDRDDGRDIPVRIESQSDAMEQFLGAFVPAHDVNGQAHKTRNAGPAERDTALP